MNDLSAVRRQRLRGLLETRRWGVNDLEQAVGHGRYSYWWTLLNDEKKPFGEKVARRVEIAVDLPPLWLDGAVSVEHAGFVLRSPPDVSYRVIPTDVMVALRALDDARFAVALAALRGAITALKAQADAAQAIPPTQAQQPSRAPSNPKTR
jgi:hypothetical protein